MADNLTDISLLKFTEGAMFTYGSEVNLERAIPDYRDGFKPVSRRSMWALYQLPKDQLMKSSRLLGDVIGKYHPHGEMSVSGAIITLVNSCTSGVTGVGNWGTLIDPAAAFRYTNLKLSTYGGLFFGRDYLPVTPMVPTYDKKGKEPLCLPSLLPNLLFNGSNGIGVGVATRIPAYTPRSVLNLMIEALENRKKVTPEACVTHLEFYHQYGGFVRKTKAVKAELKEFYSTPGGSVTWESNFEVDRDNKRVTITGFAPEVKPDRLVEDKLKPMECVQHVDQNRGGLSYTIQIKSSVNFNEFDEFVERFKKLTTSRIKYEVYVTERKLKEGYEVEGKYEVDFLKLSIPELVNRWLSWRIDLESRSLDYRIEQMRIAIKRTKLFIFACANLQVIFKALQTADPADHLVRNLKISLEEANQILDLKVRQLSSLDKKKLQELLADQESQLKILKTKREKPAREVLKFLKISLERFESKEAFAGTHIWMLNGNSKKAVEETVN
jgi:DNA gyrase/topoisomerase IV subunit A